MTLLSKPTIDDIEAHGYKVLTKSEYERMKKRLDVLERLGDREMTPEELQAIQEQANNATIRGMKVEVSEEGIVFVGKLVADPVETLRDALDEVERLRGAFERIIHRSSLAQRQLLNREEPSNIPWDVSYFRGKATAWNDAETIARQALDGAPSD